jgi:hypothetical protein
MGWLRAAGWPDDKLAAGKLKRCLQFGGRDSTMRSLRSVEKMID